MTGRGSLLHGIIDGPQIAAVLLVLAGALTLRESKHALSESKNDLDGSKDVPHEQERVLTQARKPAPAPESRGAA